MKKEEVSREQFDQRATDVAARAATVVSRRETADASAKMVSLAQAHLGQSRVQADQARKDSPRQIATQKEQLAQRKAAELAAKAQAGQAELNFEYTRIYAPEDGIVSDKQVQSLRRLRRDKSCLRLLRRTIYGSPLTLKRPRLGGCAPGNQ